MRNPLRRSRKIGLTQGGRVKAGSPGEKWSRLFSPEVWEQLSNTESDGLQVLRENPSGQYYHPCEGEEYREVLGRLPGELTCDVKAIVLRRTPKEDAKLGVEARRRYSCVILNAFPTSNLMTWRGSPGPTARRHYGRWCQGWREESGAVVLEWSPEEVRKYYLYHLFLHEVGHINQPPFHQARRREEFAENFALEWAARLNELPPAVKA